MFCINRFRLICVGFIALIAVLAGCGGDAGTQPGVAHQDAGGLLPLHSTAGFTVIPLGTASLPELELVVIDRDDQVLVEVIPSRPQLINELLIELHYDYSTYRPLAAQSSDVIAAVSDSLCLQILDVPGIVSLGQVPTTVVNSNAPAGGALASVLFAREPYAQGRSRPASEVPTHSAALSPLIFDEATGEFRWYYVNPGDFDQDGLVGLGDISPLGREYGASGPFSFFSVLSVIDGNGNGEISVSDLSTIGLYWGNLVESYHFYGSEDIGDVPSGFAESSTIEPLATYALSEAQGNTSLHRLWFNYTPEPTEAELVCWVRPVAGSAEGTPSEGTRSNVSGASLNSPPIDPGEGGEGFNLAPEAQLVIDYTGTNVPLAVDFDASSSADEDGEIVFFEWDFEGDGLFDSFSTTPLARHTFVYPGTYAPFVRVTDDGGAWDVFQVPEFTLSELEVVNIDPVGDLVATVLAGEAPLFVGLIASGSVDVDGWIEKYEWDFDGDDTFELDSGGDPTVLNEYLTPGEFRPQVRVTDNAGATAVGVAEFLITVNDPPQPNLPPQAALTVGFGEWGGNAPHMVNFDASASTDADGEIVRYWWDWQGDGFFEGTTITALVQHTYETTGGHSPTVMVEDNEGAMAAASIQVLVNESLPGPTTWWMSGRDYRHTRRSELIGSQTDNVLWTYDTGAPVKSSPSIAADGTLYFGTTAGDLVALHPDGTLYWTYPTGGAINGDPAIAGDGSIYVGSNDNFLHAVNPDGTAVGGNWPYDAGGNLYSSPMIAPDGLIYIGSYDMNLHSINPDGTVNWLYPTAGRILSTPAIGGDGTIYVGSRDKFLHAVNPDGSGKWTFDCLANVESSPAIGTDGTIYICCDGIRLYAVNAADGSQKWSSNLGGSPRKLSPAIGPGGGIVIGAYDTRSFYSCKPEGGRNWTIQAQGSVTTSAAIDAAGTVYVGTAYGLIAYDREGERQWSLSIGGADNSAPVIGPAGTVYIFNAAGVLYAVGPTP